jgi:Flp pilus assembly protein TadD
MNSHPADVLIAKGLTLQKAGQLPESIQCYLEALRIDPKPQAWWHLIIAQIASKQFEHAYSSCKSAMALYPQEPQFYLASAKVQNKLGRHDEALETLRCAVELFPKNADVLSVHATTQFQARRFVEAIPSLERLVVLRPGIDTYRTLFKLKKFAGDRDGARRTILEARERFPLDIKLAGDCAQFAPEAAEQSHAAMRDALPTLDPETRSHTLHHLTVFQAASNRKAVNLSREAAIDWTDLVRWPDPAGLAAFIRSLEDELAGNAPRAPAMAERASAAVGQMDWAGAEYWFSESRRIQTRTVADVATFDPAFYKRLEEMSDEEIWSPFPPISEIIPRSIWPVTMIYVACDPKYFELFFQRFVASLHEKQADVGVHAHILDGTMEDWSRLAKMVQDNTPISVSMTAEAGARQKFGNGARDYYHAARYVRFHQYLVQNARRAWIIDVDTLVERNPEQLFKSLDGYDIAVTTTPSTLEPWTKIRAGLVGIDPTPAGLGYIRIVAAYISYWFRGAGLRWGIDQQALFGSYFYLEQQERSPKTRFLGEEAMNIHDEMPLVFRPITDATRWEKGM